MPLIVWIYSQKHKAQLAGHLSPVFQHWSDMKCDNPKSVQNKHLVNLRASMLNCSVEENHKYRKYFLDSRPIKIRTIEKFRKRMKDSIKVVWFVQSRMEDIAYFNFLLRKENEDINFVNETISYLKRDFIVNDLPIKKKYVLCIFVIDSLGMTIKDISNDCATFYNGQTTIEFDENPAKFNNDAPMVASSISNILCGNTSSVIVIFLFIELSIKFLYY